MKSYRIFFLCYMLSFYVLSSAKADSIIEYMSSNNPNIDLEEQENYGYSKRNVTAPALSPEQIKQYVASLKEEKEKLVIEGQSLKVAIKDKNFNTEQSLEKKTNNVTNTKHISNPNKNKKPEAKEVKSNITNVNKNQKGLQNTNKVKEAKELVKSVSKVSNEKTSTLLNEKDAKFEEYNINLKLPNLSSLENDKLYTYNTTVEISKKQSTSKLQLSENQVNKSADDNKNNSMTIKDKIRENIITIQNHIKGDSLNTQNNGNYYENIDARSSSEKDISNVKSPLNTIKKGPKSEEVKDLKDNTQNIQANTQTYIDSNFDKVNPVLNTQNNGNYYENIDARSSSEKDISNVKSPLNTIKKGPKSEEAKHIDSNLRKDVSYVILKKENVINESQDSQNQGEDKDISDTTNNPEVIDPEYDIALYQKELEKLKKQESLFAIPNAKIDYSNLMHESNYTLDDKVDEKLRKSMEINKYLSPSE